MRNKALLDIQLWPPNVPEILQIGCSHPKAVQVTWFGMQKHRWLCPGCSATWEEVEPFA